MRTVLPRRIPASPRVKGTLRVDNTIVLPAYDQGELTTGIVHFGVGNFHRSHQAMYLDRLMNAGVDREWAICGVGIMPGDVRMRNALRTQDFRYTLVLKHADGSTEARSIGVIRDFLYAPDDPEAVVRQLADPSTRIVSLTITEGGYNVDSVTGEFILATPDVAEDIRHPESPRTVFGLIVAGLRRRRRENIAPFTVMSCDNIPGNGNLMRHCLTAYARAIDPELAAWIDSSVAFPNSMVDRITPVTTDADRAMVADTYGIADRIPVVAEPFEQWVLEDHFTCGRPAFEKAGVHLVGDVEPYELMKLRLLNGSHQALAYLGILAGYTYAHEAASDPAFDAFLRAYMDEAGASLPPVPGVDLAAYKNTLIERFTNPQIRDTLARLAAETSDRIPKFVLPAVRDNLAAGRSVRLAALVLASWARYVEVSSTIDDPLAETLTRIVHTHDQQPLAFIENADLFGDLSSHEELTEPYREFLQRLREENVKVVLETLF